MTAERRIGSRYVVTELLGRGGMGEVYRGRGEDGTAYAVKILRRVAGLLESSIWIRRLPPPHHCEIAKARHILQQQADLLAEP